MLPLYQFTGHQLLIICDKNMPSCSCIITHIASKNISSFNVLDSSISRTYHTETPYKFITNHNPFHYNINTLLSL